MIVKAIYRGPLPKVTVPGFARKFAVRDGEEVTLRVRDGHPIGGDWEITEGKKEYEAGIKALSDKTAAEEKARREAQAKAKADAEARQDEIEEAAYAAKESKTKKKPQPDKKGGLK